MDDGKTQELLLQLLQDIAVIKAKLDSIEEIKLDAKSMGNRIDHLEAQNREHDKTIKSLENRAGTMEQFVRNNLQDTKKQQTGIFISMGLALFSAAISLIVGFLF